MSEDYIYSTMPSPCSRSSFHTNLTDKISSNSFEIFPRQVFWLTASTLPLDHIFSLHSPNDLIRVYIPKEIISAALDFTCIRASQWVAAQLKQIRTPDGQAFAQILEPHTSSPSSSPSL